MKELKLRKNMTRDSKLCHRIIEVFLEERTFKLRSEEYENINEVERREQKVDCQKDN